MSDSVITSMAGGAPSAPPGPRAAPVRPPVRRLDVLTGLRFFAALAVFVYHATLVQLSVDPGLRSVLGPAFGGLGYLGVSFFFVLSGFVLTWSHRPTDTVPGFWVRRIARVYPNHLVTFVICLVVILTVEQGAGAWTTVTNLFLVQSWVPDYSFTNSVNGVSWSLSCELLFYLAFPFLFRALRRVPGNRVAVCAAGLALLVVAVPFVARGVLPDTPHWTWGDASYLQIWFCCTFPLTRCLEFVLGMTVARLVAEGRWRGPGRAASLVLLVLGYALSRTLPILFVYAAATAIPVALTIGAFASSRSPGRRPLLASATMVRLGELSFAFYLVHHEVVTYLGGFLAQYARSIGPVVASIALSFVLSMALAWALNVGVERPVVRAMARRQRRAAEPTAE